MKILWTDGIAGSRELAFENQTLISTPGRTRLLLDNLDENALASVCLNDHQLPMEKGISSFTFDCAFDDDGISDVLIYADGTRAHIRFQAAVIAALSDDAQQDLAHFYYTLEREMKASGDSMSLGDLFAAVRDRRIQLLAMNDRMTGLNDQSILDDIRTALPYAEGICTRPRMQLRTRYQVMDIELVKRITSHSLQHLGAHSEHWKGRTLAGLIPSRMNAITSEDKTDIYENTFFGKVMQAAFHIVGTYDLRLKKAIRQTDTLINWDRYGNAFADFRRTQMLYSLMPDYDQEKETAKRKDLDAMSDHLDGLERGLSTVLASKFYRELDRQKIQRFPLPVRPTNILKMDSRYRQILVLWQKILLEQKKKNHRSIGEKKTDAFTNYGDFVQLLFVYALSITGFRIAPKSVAKLSKNGTLMLDAHAAAQDIDRISLHIETRHLLETPYLHLTFTERQTYRMAYTLRYPIDKIRAKYPDLIAPEGGDDEIIFRQYPDRERLQNYFAELHDEVEKKGGNDIKHQGGILTQLHRQWRQLLADSIHRMRSDRTFTIALVPLPLPLHGDEETVRTATNRLLALKDVMAGEGIDSLLIAVPTDPGSPDLLAIKDAAIAHRILNYGDSFLPDDTAYGDYRVGLLPVAQDDIASAQRLAKVATLHVTRLLMDWDYAQDTCPVCGSHHVQHTEDKSYQCLNPACRATFGKPRCKHCGNTFDWIQPQGKIKKSGQQGASTLSRILELESMLGSMAITDFSYERSKDGSIRFLPRCPHCGHIAGEGDVQ